MKFHLLIFCLLFLAGNMAKAVPLYHVKSPDGKITVTVTTSGQVRWSVTHDGTPVLSPSAISMTLSTGLVLGQHAVVQKVKELAADQVLSTPFYKKSQVHDVYNQLTLQFKGRYELIFRVYDDGAAYRFVTGMKGDIVVNNEQADFNFDSDKQVYLPFVNDYRNKDKFNTSFESLYDHLHLSEIKTDSLAFLPLLVELDGGKKAAILEADLQDYPGMYLTSTNSAEHALHAVFAPYPTREHVGSLNYMADERAGYIATTAGTRSFPWRVLVLSTEDKQLADNDMVQKLAAPSKLTDVSWIKPGKVAWDWWNDWNISHVDFTAGINVPTYKYYIDFAAANKLEYIIIDEGWSDDHDLTKSKLDIQQIVDYGRQKNVGVILWSTWYAITRDAAGLMKSFSAMGVKGFKIDFIDRDDQSVVRSLYQIAQLAADQHMLVDFHGMYKPSGITRTYPNVINCEGVKGMENDKWGGAKDLHPVYDVSIPFIRMLAGPMDYTPGAMRNATRSAFRAVNANPMSQGTRCHQLAMYTVFEAPLQMLSDNPTTYMHEQESTDFISAVPTTFDQTVALDGRVAEFVCLARKKGDTWYAGALNNWNNRDLSIDLSFLGEGKYRAVIFEDGVNADRDATDYRKRIMTVTSADKMYLKLASGGGWAARFEKIP
jgi:alpha-glucosidase